MRPRLGKTVKTPRDYFHTLSEKTMSSNSTFVRYKTKQERLDAWVLNRKLYKEWRKTPDAYKFINWKRKKQQNLCFFCIEELGAEIHVDHIFPLYLGGTNFKGNLCLTHPKCNMDKGIKVPLTFKEAGHRRRQFNLMRKSAKAKERLKKNPQAKLSKKNARAITHVSKLKPIKF